MAFIVQIPIPLEEGQVVQRTVAGLMLNVDGVDTAVPFTELSDIEFNAEDIEEADILYVNYRGQDYEVPLPSPDSMDWQDVLEIEQAE